MKSQNYVIQIDNPCTQDWSSMEESEVGKHCSHCKKNVINFIGLKDNEVIQIIENTSGNLCGRFDKTQLNRILIHTGSESNNLRLYKILAGLLLISSADHLTLFSQKQEIEIVSQIRNSPFSNIEPDKQHQDSLKNVITGTITDTCGNALVGTAVRIVGTQFGSIADFDGNYSLKVPDAYSLDTVTVEVCYLGYLTHKFSIIWSELPMIKNIVLLSDYKEYTTVSVMGALVMSKLPKDNGEKRIWWRRKKKN